jgi:APA family basic amino acid/polyamine antiporter
LARYGWILIQGELTRSMAAQGLLPSWLAATDRNGTPRVALVVTTAAASVFALMNASRSMQGLFEFLLLLTTSATLWFYLACALAALRLKVARPAAALGAVFALGTLWGAGIVPSGLSLVLMAAGLPIYWWARRERTVKPGEDRYNVG